MSGPVVLLIIITIGIWWYNRPAHMQAIWQFVRPSGTAPTPPVGQTRKYQGIVNVTLIVAAATIVYWGLAGTSNWGNPRFAVVSAWAWNHWLTIALLTCVIAAAVANNASATAKKLLLTILFGVVAFLFVGTWLLDWGGRQLGSIAATTQHTEVLPTRCPLASLQERRGCDITSATWSPAVRWEGGRDSNVKMCYSRGILSQRTDEGATIFNFRVPSKEGMGLAKDRVEYQLYPLDTDCRLVGF